MTCLKRNQQQVYYANYRGKTPLLDNNGYDTGEKIVSYSSPIAIMANVSVAKGEAQIEQFGTSVQYDKVIVLSDVSLQIDENTVFFIDVTPQDNALNYDYIVAKIARSLNYIAIAIKRCET